MRCLKISILSIFLFIFYLILHLWIHGTFIMNHWPLDYIFIFLYMVLILPLILILVARLINHAKLDCIVQAHGKKIILFLLFKIIKFGIFLYYKEEIVSFLLENKDNFIRTLFIYSLIFILTSFIINLDAFLKDMHDKYNQNEWYHLSVFLSFWCIILYIVIYLTYRIYHSIFG